MLVELKQLTIDYTKQQTLDPLKTLGRFLAFGVAGSIALGIGLTLWVIAALRALQNETGSAFTGHLTWVPYLITLLVVGLLIAVAARAIGRDRRAADKRKQERAAAAKTSAGGFGKESSAKHSPPRSGAGSTSVNGSSTDGAGR